MRSRQRSRFTVALPGSAQDDGLSRLDSPGAVATRGVVAILAELKDIQLPPA
jgi:hypothetical protein